MEHHNLFFMKKIFTLFLFLSLIPILSFGQKSISGIYYNQSGMCIKVEQDNLYFIIPQSHSPIFANDTLATCTYRWIDDQFVELNSPPPYVLGREGLKVVQSFDSAIKDSIKIAFAIPYKRWNLKIVIYTDTFKVFDLDYSESSKELMLPSNIKTISFEIVPENILRVNDALSYGMVGFNSMQEYHIDQNVNHVEIEIPTIDDAFFEKYYVKGEYARVLKNTITWKGEIFKKEK